MEPPLSFAAWLRHDLIFEALRRVPDRGRVLEIGAGQGAMGWRIARRFSYVGVEPDPVSAASARARLPTVHRSLDEVDGDFDAVCAFEVLEHIEDDATALAGWMKRLKPGGLVVLSVPAWQRRFGPADVAVGHYRRYDPPQLERLLAGVGLGGVSVHLYGWPLGYALEAVRNLIAARRERTGREEATASSGRFLQPPPWAGAATRAATWPFRRVQGTVDRGVGIVATAVAG